MDGKHWLETFYDFALYIVSGFYWIFGYKHFPERALTHTERR